MWRSIAVVFSMLVGCNTLAFAGQTFSIYSAPSIRPLEVRYFLAGAFGGLGGFVRERDEDGTYRIPLEQEGTLANSLKAILYAPGCQFTTLSLDLTSDATRAATFECRYLPTVSVKGTVSALPQNTASYDLVINYSASWGHRFFGLVDGVVQSFRVARVPLDVDGHFQAQIPDFSQDTVTSQRTEASLEFLVMEQSTGNLVFRRDVKISPTYDSEMVFADVPAH